MTLLNDDLEAVGDEDSEQDDLDAPEKDASLGSDASWAELRELPMPELIAWADAHPEEWDALKEGAGAPQATERREETDVENDEGAPLDDLTEDELDRFIAEAFDRIEDADEARELSLLKEQGGPDGSPSRLRALQAAAVYALQVAGPEPGAVFLDSPFNTVTWDPTHRERIETDAFGNVRRTKLETASTEAADKGSEFTGRETMADVAKWGMEKALRFRDQFPDRWELLKRQESDRLTNAANQAGGGIVR